MEDSSEEDEFNVGVLSLVAFIVVVVVVFLLVLVGSFPVRSVFMASDCSFEKFSLRRCATVLTGPEVSPNPPT